MTAKKSVTFLTTGLNYGGAETQLMQLATRFKTRGWSVQVISMLPPESYVKDLTASGISVLSLNMHRGKADPRAVFRLAAILRYQHPSILHAHMVHANLLARISRLLVHVPVVICTAHNIIEGNRWREIAYRLTDPLCDLTTQVSEAGLARYVRVGAVPRHKICFMPNGVDVKRFSFKTEERQRLRAELGMANCFTWLAVGRLEEVKDYPVLLRAFAQVQQQQPEVKLFIVGQGVLKENIVTLANTLRLTDHVHLLGIRQDVANLMSAADGYVMSSMWEGMPMVLLEASATGLPIVATRVGGIPEIVLDGQTGFLTPPKDPAALAQAMLHLMSLPAASRLTMGQAGRTYIAAHYSLEQIVNQWEALYTELLQKKQLSLT